MTTPAAAPTRLDSPTCAHEALLHLSESIAAHRELTPLFHELVERLPRVVTFDSLWLVLHDPASGRMRLQTLVVAGGVDPASEEWPLERPIEEAPSGLVWQSQEPLIVTDVEEEQQRYPAAFRLLTAQRVRSCCIIPLTSAHRRLGAVGFGSHARGAYSAASVDFLDQVARQIAVAVDNALSHDEAEKLRRELVHDRDRLRLILDLSNSLPPGADLRRLFAAISEGVLRVVACDYASVVLPEPDSRNIRVYARRFSGGEEHGPEEIVVPLVGTPAGKVLESGELLALDAAELAGYNRAINPSLEGLHSACFLPLIAHNRIVGTLNAGRFSAIAFPPEDIEFLRQIASQVATAVESAVEYHEISESRQRLAEEKLYLSEEIKTEHNFEEIVGGSPALKSVLRQVEIVAPTDSTVLILGETGTGKELIARAIHNLSGRRDHTFVKVNCAAIPLGLLESELFGHEKGAFTGAIERKVGRFELAHQGTLFLDELGDIPLELQPKLLRVLQEHEFERLGSTRTIHVDVRLLAATSRDLEAMVDDREFRSDLYYRVNVFPVTVPPLRERREDVPLLVEYFAARYAERLGKKVDRVGRQTMNLLHSYHWPGNIRELQNIIERGVILAQDGTLNIDPSVLRVRETPAAGGDIFEQSQRELIEEALGACQGRVAGARGAAARLGIPPSTLESKIRSLRIDKHRFRPRV